MTRCLQKLWYIHSAECESAAAINKLLTQQLGQISNESCQIKKQQSLKVMYGRIPFIHHPGNDKITEMENRPVIARGRGQWKGGGFGYKKAT